MTTRRQCMGLGLGLLARGTPAAEVSSSALKRPLALLSNCLDLIQAGTRLVCVGERGHVLLSDDQGKTWRQAASVPTRTTLTAAYATDAQRLWAVGHGGLLLRSTDGGEHWQIAQGSADGSDTLLSIRVEADGRGLAVGGFGYALRSQNGGASWQRAELLAGKSSEAGERHCNRIFVSAQGTWLIAGESGQVLRSDDGGGQWQAVATPYAGSLWSGLAVADGVLLACGMRGNLLRSSDDGRSWRHIAVPQAGSLCGIALTADQRPLIVGLDGSLVLGNRAAEQFTFQRLQDRSSLTAVLGLGAAGVALATVAGPRLLRLEDLAGHA